MDQEVYEHKLSAAESSAERQHRAQADLKAKLSSSAAEAEALRVDNDRLLDEMRRMTDLNSTANAEREQLTRARLHLLEIRADEARLNAASRGAGDQPKTLGRRRQDSRDLSPAGRRLTTVDDGELTWAHSEPEPRAMPLPSFGKRPAPLA